MKKTINTQAIANELAEGSVFFPQPKASDTSTVPTSQPAEQIQNKEQPRHHDTVIPRYRDTTTPYDGSIKLDRLIR